MRCTVLVDLPSKAKERKRSTSCSSLDLGRHNRRGLAFLVVSVAAEKPTIYFSVWNKKMQNSLGDTRQLPEAS